MRTPAFRIIPPPKAPVLITTATRTHPSPKLASRFQNRPTKTHLNHLSPTNFNRENQSKRTTSLKILPVPQVGSIPVSSLYPNSDKDVACNVYDYILNSKRSQLLQQKSANAQAGFEPEHQPIVHPQDIVPVPDDQSKTADRGLLQTSNTAAGFNIRSQKHFKKLSGNSNFEKMDSEPGFDGQQSFFHTDVMRTHANDSAIQMNHSAVENKPAQI